ncbi:hypothetical protein J6590_042922 [Homalodisca vitripennis]|nr:hypothetical protein J6590_042922 [Homalodisca vitripennis]
MVEEGVSEFQEREKAFCTQTWDLCPEPNNGHLRHTIVERPIYQFVCNKARKNGSSQSLGEDKELPTAKTISGPDG